MQAKKMFEGLGYVQTINKELIKDTLIIYDNRIDRITFNVESKYFSNTVYYIDKKGKDYLDKLNKAINKQIEELGWLDEKGE